MGGLVQAFVVLAVVLATLTFLTIRFKFFSGEGLPGRFAFLMGAILLVAASGWELVTSMSNYPDWFVLSAYGYFDLVQIIILIGGILLVITGLSFYADYWEIRREDIETLEGKLTILPSLQRDSNGPYHFLELLNMTIREIVSHLPETSGAIFLINRSRKQFVLTSSAGLTKQEISSLEYYPLERNIVSQAVELGEPIIAGRFDLGEGTAEGTESRFNSSLILPLVSGNERLGGIIVFSEEMRGFSNLEIKYLAPVAEWLAGKINAARQARELVRLQQTNEQQSKTHTEFVNRLSMATASIDAADPISSFCESLVGLSSCTSVHLCGTVAGGLRFFGASEPVDNLSENFKTALIDSIDRRKPIVINQEASGDDGRSFVTHSTLVYPLSGESNALLLRRESALFELTDADLKIAEVFAQLATALLKVASSNRMSVRRRKGFEQILRLMDFSSLHAFQENPSFLVDHLVELLPAGSLAVCFVRENDGSLKIESGSDTRVGKAAGLVIYQGEGDIGRAKVSDHPSFVVGRANISKSLQQYDLQNRETFLQMFGERGLPVFAATCPISVSDNLVGVVAVYMFDVDDENRLEWERLLTLASGLYSIGLTIASLDHGLSTERTGAEERAGFGLIINRINNHLSAILSTAEITAGQEDISGGVRERLKSIVIEAEKAATFVRKSLGETTAVDDQKKPSEEDAFSLITSIETVLEKSCVSENLHMIGGRPREINIDIEPGIGNIMGFQEVPEVFEQALLQFSESSEDDDVISISIYLHKSHLFLDLSRHRKNFPSVERVAGFGTYSPPAEALKQRPGDSYLRLLDPECLFAVDRFSRVPSYVSFRIPVSAPLKDSGDSSVSRMEILAIDDQSIILDLLKAMFQSLGHGVTTASSGREGVNIARSRAFNIVLTDLAMPDMSGLQTAREIKNLHPETPIILLTGWEATVDKSQLESAGIDQVLYKPFRIEQLTEIIETAMISTPVADRNSL